MCVSHLGLDDFGFCYDSGYGFCCDCGFVRHGSRLVGCFPILRMLRLTCPCLCCPGFAFVGACFVCIPDLQGMAPSAGSLGSLRLFGVGERCPYALLWGRLLRGGQGRFEFSDKPMCFSLRMSGTGPPVGRRLGIAEAMARRDFRQSYQPSDLIRANVGAMVVGKWSDDFWGSRAGLFIIAVCLLPLRLRMRGPRIPSARR